MKRWWLIAMWTLLLLILGTGQAWAGETKTVRVMSIEMNPILEIKGGIRLRDYMHWNNPLSMEATFINDIRQLSGGYVDYKVVSRVDGLDFHPTKSDGFRYTDQTYLDVIEGRKEAHKPDAPINYNELLDLVGACDKVNAGEVDEIWVWGPPWFGMWEATMVGPNRFFTNGDPVAGSKCNRAVHVMAFNVERGVPEMLEALGHRAEGTFDHFFGAMKDRSTDWGKFSLYDQVKSGGSRYCKC